MALFVIFFPLFLINCLDSLNDTPVADAYNCISIYLFSKVTLK